MPTDSKGSGQARPSPARRVVQRSVLGPMNLGVIVSAVVGALAIHSWPLALVGVVAYGALVAWDLTSPSFVRKALDVAPAPRAALPSPGRMRHPAARRALEGIVEARAELARVLAETPDEVMGYLGGALDSIADLEERAGRLAVRADSLAEYLATVDPAQMKAEVSRLAGLAARATDPEARREYEGARAAREEHLRAVSDVSAAGDRINARLEAIAAALEALPAKVVRMKALDAQAMDHLSGDIAGELSTFNNEIRGFEETLRSLEEVRVA